MNSKTYMRLGLVGMGALGIATMFQTNLYTNRTQFILWGQEFDESFGRFTSKIIAKYYNKYKHVQENSMEHQLVQDLVDFLVKHSIHPNDKLQDRKWKVKIIKVKDVNAMVCCDGSIFVLRGLLKEAQSLDEVAFILSHEISHVLCRHIPNQVCTSGLFGLILIMLTQDLFFVNFLYDLLYSKPQSRQNEMEADTCGVQICIKSGFDAVKGAEFFQRLQKIEKHHATVLSTHPTNTDRIKNIQEIHTKYHSNYYNQYGEDEEQIQQLTYKFKKLKLAYKQQQSTKKQNNK